MNNIQIFAADFRKNIKWDLPYVRLGNFQSDAAIKTSGDKKRQLQFAEAANIFWTYDNYAEIGDPDYIGFCHYRRFFVDFKDLNRAIFVFPDKNPVAIQNAVSPMQQYAFLKGHSIDGIVPVPFLESFMQQEIIDNTKPEDKKKFNSLAEYFHIQLEQQNVGMPLEMVVFALEQLCANLPDNMKGCIDISANAKLPVHFGAMFTLSKERFFVLAQTLKKTLDDVIEHFGEECFMKMNFRALAYLNERLCSCMMYAFKMSGSKLANMPIAVLDEKNRTSSRIDTLEEMMEKTNA